MHPLGKKGGGGAGGGAGIPERPVPRQSLMVSRPWGIPHTRTSPPQGEGRSKTRPHASTDDPPVGNPYISLYNDLRLGNSLVIWDGRGACHQARENGGEEQQSRAEL